MYSGFMLTRGTGAGGDNSNSYVTKVGPTGTAEWEVKISNNATAAPLSPEGNLCDDGAGGIVAVWIDSNVSTNGRVKAQRIDKAGNKVWTSTGIAITGSGIDTATKRNCWVAKDSSGNFIVGWIDNRDTANGKVYAQKLAAADGSVQWTADGVTVDADTSDTKDDLRVLPGTSGASIVVYRRATTVYATKLDSSGAVSWGPTSTVTGVPTSGVWGDVCSDGSGGIFVLATASNVVKIHPLNSAGNSAGTTSLSNGSLQALAYGVASDGGSGAIAWWHERNNTSNPSTYNVRAQKVNSSGTIQWASGGVSVATSASTNSVATRPYTAVADGSGGSICCAELPESGGAFELHVFKVDSSGTVSWDTTMDSSSIDGAKSTVCSDGAGGAFVAFDTASNTAVIRRINSSGSVQWSGETGFAHDFWTSQEHLLVRGANVHAEIDSPVTDIEFVRGIAGNRNIRIDNDGENEDLVVTAMTCSDSHVSVTTTLPVTIAPGSHQTVVAHYDGSGLADATSTITSTSNTETNPELNIAVGI